MKHLHIDFVMGYTGCFFIGHYLNTYTLQPLSKKIIYTLGGLSPFLIIGLTALYTNLKGAPVTYFYSYLNILCILNAAAIFLFTKNFFSKINFSTQTAGFIQLIGKMTFFVYLAHVFVLIFLEKLGFSAISFNTFFAIPILTLIIFICSTALGLLVNKIPTLNKYIM